MKNRGKQFEQLIQESCLLQNIECIRLKDAGYQGESTDRRFTITNICDFIVFNGSMLLKLEVKHTEGKSIPLTRLKQLTRLAKSSKTNLINVREGFLFRFLDNIYFCEVYKLIDIIESTKKKSLNEKEIAEVGIKVDTYLPNKKRNKRIDMEFMNLL